METKNKIILISISLLVAFAFGRYSAPEKIKTVEVEKKTDDKETDRHKIVKIIETTKPDGSKIKDVTITDDTKQSDKSTDDVSKTTEKTYSSSKTTVSALGGINLNGIPQPVYGVSVYKPVLGPIGIGVWGLSDKTVGASVGLSF